MKEKDYYHDTFNKFIEAYGIEAEMRMCIEEMSELTKELCKFIRYSKNVQSPENDRKLEEIKQNIIEETADVLICASQMKKFFGEAEVENVMDYKIERGRNIVEKYLQDKN